MIRNFSRSCRLGFACALSVTLALSNGIASAQTYPDKLIRAIIPYSAGGPNDTVGRTIMNPLSQRLGQPIIVDNRAGANGTIAVGAVAAAPADGYTLLIGDMGSLTILPALRSDLKYDTLRDFEPVSVMVGASVALMVKADLPVKTLPELIAYAKARPGKLSYGSNGQGSTLQMAMELLKSRAGMHILHIPYKGGPQLTADLLGGQIDMAFVNISTAPQLVKTGKVRALAVGTPQRSPLMPELPAVAELYPGFEMITWTGLLAPKGTPKPIIDKLHAEVVAVLKDPQVAEKFTSTGQLPIASTPQQYTERLKKELAQWSNLVKTANIKITD